MRRVVQLVCGAVLLAAGAAAVAHDLYILPGSFRVRPGGLLRVAFHNGDAFPESEVAPHPERLVHAVLKGNRSEAAVRNVTIAGNEAVGEVVVPAEGSLFLVVQTRPNLIELAPDEFLSYLKEEGLTGVIDWRAAHGATTAPGHERYTKFAKSLVVSGTADDFYKMPTGLLLEIVPLQNPSSVRAGEALPVQVLFQGKPAADLQVEAAWAGAAGERRVAAVGRTDRVGRIAVPIAAVGRWRLHALKMVRCKDTSVADWESSWASLTFEVRPPER